MPNTSSSWASAITVAAPRTSATISDRLLAPQCSGAPTSSRPVGHLQANRQGAQLRQESKNPLRACCQLLPISMMDGARDALL